MTTVKVLIEGYLIEEVADEMREVLQDQDIDIQVSPSLIRFDGLSLDPPSIIASGASVAAALITALFAYLGSKKSGSIIIKAGDKEIVVPRDTSQNELENYIKLAKQLGVDIITVRDKS